MSRPRPRWLGAPAVLIGATLSILSVNALAAPWGVRLSFTGATDTRIGITWNTDAETATSAVRYGTSPSALSATAAGTSTRGAGAIGWIHEVELTDLAPDTVYTYRAGDDADGWSDPLAFRTAPPEGWAPADGGAGPRGCAPLSFVVVADDRSFGAAGPSENWSSIALEAASEAPAFMLNGGDIVHNGDQPEQWKNWLLATEPVLGRFAHMPAVGNHDVGPGEGDGANYNQVFQLPRAAPSEGGGGTEDYYWFRWGDVLFVSLSTATMRGEGAPFAAQAAWLDRVLTLHPATWRIVFFHHPIYTGTIDLLLGSASHPPNERGQNPAFEPVLARHGVDLVFQSHNHWYERFAPSACGDGRTTPCPTDDGHGTVYVTTGGAGAFTYDVFGINACPISAVDGRVACDGRHHYVAVTIDGDTLRARAQATAAQNVGNSPANRALIDEWTIVKPGAACPAAPDAGPVPLPRLDASPPRDAARASSDAPSPIAAPAAGCGCALGRAPH